MVRAVNWQRVRPLPVLDIGEPVWAGVLPIQQVFGEPIPASNLNPGIEPPTYIKNW